MVSEHKLAKKDLQEPDQFLILTGRFLEFYSRHKNAILLLAILVVLGLAGGLWFYNYQQSQALRMESLYFEMEKIRDNSKESSLDAVIPKMKSLLDQFDNGIQKLRAQLLLADTYYENRNFDEALKLYSRVADSTQPRELNHYLALSGMAYVYESKKEYDKAIETYKTIIDRAGNFPLFYTYLGMARSYELAGDPKNALLTLREMEPKYQDHPDIGKVVQMIKRLEGSA